MITDGILLLVWTPSVIKSLIKILHNVLSIVITPLRCVLCLFFLIDSFYDMEDL